MFYQKNSRSFQLFNYLMKKNNIYLLFILFITLINGLQAQAPGWAWANNGGGTGDEAGKSVTTDIYGNVYITGFFRSKTIQFGTATLANTDTSGNTDDIFLVKYDSLGALLWAKSFGGPADEESTSLTTDYLGNVYLTANYTSLVMHVGFVTLTNANTDSTTLTYDAFTAKFNQAGNVQWAKSFGGYYDENINGITSDAAGNTYITGYFSSDTVYFDTSKVITHGGADIFIAKLDLFGDVLWAKNTGGTMDDKSFAIATDSIGNIAITGLFYSNTISFDTIKLHKRDTTGTVSSGYSNDIFTAKYNPAGKVLWAKSAGGSYLYADDANSNAVAMDKKGNVYITGYFRYDSIYFGNIKLYSPAESRDVFITKYNSSNGRVDWAKHAGNMLDDSGNGISMDKKNNIYVTGYFSYDTIMFDNDTIIGHSMDAEIFIVKLDTTGTVKWAKSAGGTNGDFSNAIATFDVDKVYITGQYYSPTISFDGFTVTNQGIGDVFVARLFPLLLEVPTYSEFKNDLLIYPNPTNQYSTISYTLSTSAVISIEIYNALGEKVSTVINKQMQQEGEYHYIFTTSQSGIYFVKLQTEDEVKVKRVVFTK